MILETSANAQSALADPNFMEILLKLKFMKFFFIPGQSKDK